MKQKKWIKLTILVILASCLILWVSGVLPKQIAQISRQMNRNETLRAVVVKVTDHNFLAMGIENGTELYSIGFENLELKKGQEILIHFDGGILTSYPAQLGEVENIEILKEKSDTTIPEEILRFCYSSKENVTIKILELSKEEITIEIEDQNELPYRYANSYCINKKVKNENYTGVGQQIGENTKDSIAGYTRNRLRIHLGRSREKFG